LINVFRVLTNWRLDRGGNVTSASFGWLGAASLGGWTMAEYGFGMFGPLAACVGVIGGTLALVGRR
jgi:DHA1 family inner membrane transport protein